jgi:hypothetical protein
MRSPAGRHGFQTAYRRVVAPAAMGSFVLLTWVKHVRGVEGRAPLSSAGELEVCMLGAMAATVIVLLGRRLWYAWRSADAA